MRSIPGLFLVLIVASKFRVGPEGLAVIIGITSWMGGARLVRGQALQIREMEYIGAARAIGADNRRILAGRLLPNVLPIAIVLLGIDVGEAILRESALSYLGLGISTSRCELGRRAARRARPAHDQSDLTPPEQATFALEPAGTASGG